MKKQLFHENWTVEKGVKDPFEEMMGISNGEKVTLPHDAMIFEERSRECANGGQTGYYPCYSYTYTKSFYVPEEWKDMQTILEFEGVMRKAMVYVNGELIGRHAYGYSQFFVDLGSQLKYGTDNQIKVIAINEDRSSRWYPGSGIYRDVNLYTGGTASVAPEGIRIKTESVEDSYAVIGIDTEIRGIMREKQEIILEICLIDSQGRKMAEGKNAVTVPGRDTAISHMRLTVPDPDLWSVDTPSLYQCIAVIRADDKVIDSAEETFGIRTLCVDARKGLRINGESVELRGACIHHDNGVIGACTLERAEEYRIRKLKEAGFNSIRSSHHPMSKAMLRVCDRMGMLVMDELCDMWNTPKNSNDFSFEFADCWKDEVRRMIAKDYNHPCVIMYSVGNEMPEAGMASGRIQCRQIANLLRCEDSGRFVTAGVNGMLALRGMTMEEGAQLRQDFPQGGGTATVMSGNERKSSAEGSEKLNDVMGDISFEERDALNSLPVFTRLLDEICGELDVVGLNYMPARYTLEHKLHPDHVVVGSESYPTEIARLWKSVEENPYVIGDFTWTGYDYLGEAGIGSFHYEVMPEGQGIYPDRLAYCGDINLNGYRRPMSYLREIVFGLRKTPFIAVERVDRYGYGCLRNHWKYDDAVDSWTFPGYEGKPAKLKVLSPSEEVELFLNGVSQGKKPAGKDHGFEASYELSYEPGELTAVGFDKGMKTAQITIHTAGTAAKMEVYPNTKELIADGRDALILDICVTDENGIPNMWEEKEITVEVEGPAYLAGFGNANPSSEGSYQDHTCKTFDGRVIAVIRSDSRPGTVTVRLTASGLEDAMYVCENVTVKGER